MGKAKRGKTFCRYNGILFKKVDNIPNLPLGTDAYLEISDKPMSEKKMMIRNRNLTPVEKDFAHYGKKLKTAKRKSEALAVVKELINADAAGN